MPNPQKNQQGISLFVVLIIVLLSTLFVLWSSRKALFNEMVVGNDADYQRAFEAAQAMVQDAELDVSGERLDGSLCRPDPSKPNTCRVATNVWFPEDGTKVTAVLNQLEAQTTGCLLGICTKRVGNQDFWNDASTLNAMQATGARFGQFTGAVAGSGNIILSNTSNNQGAWYWVEILPYDTTPGNLLAGAPKIELNINPAIVYRITAIARGLRPGTQVVLQSTLARQKMKD